jgi:hypothetical protein
MIPVVKAPTETSVLPVQEHEQIAGSIGRDSNCSFRKAMPLLCLLGLAEYVIGGSTCTFPVGVVKHRENLPIVVRRVELTTVLCDEAISVLRRQANT